CNSSRKPTCSAASPLSAGGSRARSTQGRGASRKIQGQARSNMLANPQVDGLAQGVQRLVVQPATGPVGAFHQHHPAGQAGGGAATVQEGQPGAAGQRLALALRIALQAQALEQGVVLLQPGAGLVAVGRAQAVELVQSGQAQRVELN